MKSKAAEGTIIKGYSGFYYVLVDGNIYTCSLRGKFRLKENSRIFLPGDRVLFTVIQGDKGVIEDVLPRRNELLRPPIANVDQVLLVFALASPDPDFSLIDRLLVLAYHAGITPVIIWNKADIVSPVQVEEVKSVYEQCVDQQVTVSSKHGQGIEKVQELLQDRISVLAGPSGAGKSTLLNAVCPGFALKTGDVSEKIGRGRHTTRHVELLTLPSGALVADTPGFSTLYLPDIPADKLGMYFPEMASFLDRCRFSTCQHNAEPDCAIKDAVERGIIHRQRYRHYLLFLQELIERERRSPKGRKS